MEEHGPSGSGGAPPGSNQSAEKGRKDRRKAAKKEKRKQKRREMAEKEKADAEARLNDPEEQRRIEMEDERERERIERERVEFEEKERLFLEALAEKKRREEAEAEEKEREEEETKRNQVLLEDENESDWEYVEDGPPEIIWQGNEIIVKKKKVKVKKKDRDQLLKIEDPSRPTSNPFPPESESFVDSKNETVVSAQQILDNAAQQNPNFGTEQDKAHCPFQIKTGACRFGLRCSRLHFYPDKSCTLLIKNMYNGPGLAFEQDEGLEHTDEEVDHCFEEFYEDVHTEFLKFGEIVNFKVCRNSSLHLRGNLYVHYKSMDSALLAYQSVNGRYFAGKQITCEFVGVTKWRVAICGEFMRSRLKTCSRGAACNFIHCFRNPGGDYEWADWDKPPPRYWVQEMVALFGHSPESAYVNQRNTEGRKSSERATNRDYRRSQSRERRSSRDHRHDEYDSRGSRHHKGYHSRNRKSIEYLKSRNEVHNSDSDRDQSYDERDEDSRRFKTRISNRHLDNQDYHESNAHRSDSEAYWSDIDRDRERNRNVDGRRNRKRDEDVHRKHKGKSSTLKRKSGEKSDISDEDMHYKMKRKSSTPKRKSRKKSDISDEDMHHKTEGKSSTSKKKSWDNTDTSDEDIYHKMKRKSLTPKRKSWDKTDSSDEDMHHKTKGKSSSYKRKSRDRWDNTDGSEFIIEDKGKRHKRSRKSSEHSNEDIERRGRWDYITGVEN